MSNTTQSRINADRHIRVFVSSTFKDMQNEREVLIKHIFPQLRKLCESRGVVWGEVDLRWGIPDEAKAEGKVLPICLAEIHRCRPYFIGLLGERYGWVPDEIPEELITQEPWLKEHLHHSVTELEILHGVLNNPEMADHAFFYLRDTAYTASRPLDEQKDFIEYPTDEEIDRFGSEEAQRRGEARRSKLRVLKDRLRRSSLPLRENYRDPKELGELVRRDLTAVIDRLFPAGSLPSLLDREAAAHEAYARSRAVVEVRPGEFSGVYIGRQEYLKRLDAHVQREGPPLIVLGESGMGKSALLVNWALGYRNRHPPDHLILHFIGADPTSADWAAMLRRIMGEFKRRFDISQDIPDQPDALRLAFANFLSMAAAQGRVILIIDALNHLEDKEGAPDLVWLPPVIPPNVRLILSTLPGRPLDELAKRGWPSLTVQPLEIGERRQLIEKYLDQYCKKLSPPFLERLAAVVPTANPLYLRALLEEMRVYGDHYTLKSRLDHYLAAPGVKELFKLVLARYEDDYEEDRPGLVKEAMSLIYAARRGLSRTELLELLGQEGKPLPGGVWSPLLLAAEHALIDRAGLISFSHDYFRQAVRDRYLEEESKRSEAHLRLADYFDRHDLEIAGRPNLRKIDELPWQLARTEAWESLQGLLVEPEFFLLFWENNKYEVKSCWSQIEANSSLRLVDAYRKIMDCSSELEAGFLWAEAQLLDDTGHREEALAVRVHMEEYFRQTGDSPILLSACLGGKAVLLKARGDLDGAMASHQEEERLCRELGNNDGLQACLGNQALILQDWGNLDRAMALLKEQEHLCRELGNKDGLQTSLGNQANILHAWGDLEGAMALLKEAERLCQELGNKDGLQDCLSIQAAIFKDKGDSEGAMALLKEEERLCQELGNKNRLQACVGNQAAILYIQGELEAAMALYKKQELLCQQLDNIRGMSFSLLGQGTILRDRGELKEAMSLFKEVEHLYRELGIKDGLQDCLGKQGLVLQALGDLDAAMNLHQEQELLCRKLKNKRGIAKSLLYQTGVLSARGDLIGAMTLLKDQECLCREIGNPYGLALSLLNQALLLVKMGKNREALPLATEAHHLSAAHGYTVLAGKMKAVLDWLRSRLN